MALSDKDVVNQLKSMQDFIAMEANEKVEEIDAKAEEEFQIEKSRLVQTQRIVIMEYYKKKEKQLELVKKIQDSTLMNQSRIRVLQSKEEHVQNLVEEAKEKLKETTKNADLYKKTLEGLILQGLFQLLEDVVIIICVKRDVSIIEGILPKVKQLYKEKTTKDVNITLSTTQYLNDSISGGCVLQSKDAKIKVDNTLEARLDQIVEKTMPRIRETLFGVNKNRKFRD